jgi:stage II sporulation protein D
MRTVRAALALTAALLAAPATGAGAASRFFIRGGGNGHGIGMSQYGTEGYAEHGKSHEWILAHYYRGTSLGRVDPRQTVRVLLRTGSAGFSGATRAAGRKLNPSATYAVRVLPNGWIGVFSPAGKQVARGVAPLSVSGPGPLEVAGLGAYRGSLEFTPDGSGGVDTVEAVALDDYVRGVIADEIPASWSPQALETQAVAARTYAITTDVGGGVYDLYRDTRSQMYGGVSAETPATDAAVAATGGQVVTYHGHPVVTYFFSSSGGHTENIENVWPGTTPEPWLRGVTDPYDGAAGDPYHRWSYELTPAAAGAKLRGFLKGSLVGIRIVRTGVSPRVLAADVVGTRGTVRVTGIQLQHAFGLLTTYMRFTMVQSRTAPSARNLRAAMSVPGDATLIEVLGIPQDVVGSVFPAAPRAVVAVQERVGSHWTTIGHTVVGRHGGYALTLPGRGSYRVVYHGFDGPPVTVG